MSNLQPKIVKTDTTATCFSVNPDTTNVIIGDHNGDIKIIDLSATDSGKHKREKAHTDNINVCVYKHDSTYIISGSDDNYLMRFDSKLEQCIKQRYHSDSVRCCTYSNNGQMVCCAVGRDLLIYDDELYILQDKEDFHTQTITACCFSNDDKYILTGSEDNTIKIIEVEDDYKTIKSFDFKKMITSCTFSSNTEFIACAFDDFQITVFEWQSGTVKNTLQEKGKINKCYFVNSEKSIISCALDRLTLWDIENAAPLIKIPHKNVFDCTIAYDKKKFNLLFFQ